MSDGGPSSRGVMGRSSLSARFALLLRLVLELSQNGRYMIPELDPYRTLAIAAKSYCLQGTGILEKKPPVLGTAT